MSQVNLQAAIQEALNSGALQSPVVLYGKIMQAGAIPVGGGVDPIFTFADNGWSNQSSAIGGVASQGVQELKARLKSKGFATIAAKIPTYHISRFWQAPESLPADFATPDNDRYAAPSEFLATQHELTNGKVAQIVSNLSKMNSHAYGQAMGLGIDYINNLYRGRADQEGFSLFGGRPSIMPYPGIPKNFDWNPIEENFPQYRQDAYHYEGRVEKEAYPDHFIYDLFFNTQDDGDVTRFWTSWARALGAPV